MDTITRPTRRGLLERLAALLAAAALAFGPLAATPAAAQPTLTQGKLLIATRRMADTSWEQTVLLLLHHDSNGSLAIAVNRPTWVEPSAVAPALDEIEGYDGTVFRGGPVAPTQMIFLVRNPPPGTLSTTPILNGVHAGSDLSVVQALAAVVGGTSALRLYAGHAEWRAGQLEREIAEGFWIVADGSASRVFAAEPTELWQLLRAGDELLVGPVSPLPPAASSVAPISPLRPAVSSAASTSPR